MNKQDRRIGFKTSFTDMQDDFDKVSTFLKARKIEWNKLGEYALSSAAKETKDLKDMYQSSPNELLVILQTSHINYWRLLEVITQLGIATTYLHEQVNNIEKDVKELKLRLK